MAITSSAKKAWRASLQKRVFNLRRKAAVTNAVKEIKKLLALKKIEEALASVPKAYKAIDKAAKNHTIKKGAADRKKSRLMAMIKRV